MFFAYSETPFDKMSLCVFLLLLVTLIMFYLLIGIYHVHLVPQKLYVLSFPWLFGLSFPRMFSVLVKKDLHTRTLPSFDGENMSMTVFCDLMNV